MKTMQLFKLCLLFCILMSIAANVFSQNVPRGRSNDSPVLLVAMGRLYLAWSDKDNKRLQITSSLDGINWAPKVELRETSDKAPSLAYFNERFYLAWRGNDKKNHLNIISSPDGGRTWIDKITFRDGNIVARTIERPAILSAGGKLNLMWNNREDRHIDWISSVDGMNWNFPISRVYNPLSVLMSSVSYINNAIVSCPKFIDFTSDPMISYTRFLYFSESDRRWVEFSRLDNVASISLIETKGRLYAVISLYGHVGFFLYSSSLSPIDWREEFYFNETSSYVPALAFYNNQFFVAWTGTDKDRRLNVMSSHDGFNWGNKITFR